MGLFRYPFLGSIVLSAAGILCGPGRTPAQGPADCDCVCLRLSRSRVVERSFGPAGYGQAQGRFTARQVIDAYGRPVFIIEETTAPPFPYQQAFGPLPDAAFLGGRPAYYGGSPGTACPTGTCPLSSFSTPQGYYLPPAGVSESFGTWTGPPAAAGVYSLVPGGCPGGVCPRR